MTSEEQIVYNYVRSVTEGLLTASVQSPESAVELQFVTVTAIMDSIAEFTLLLAGGDQEEFSQARADLSVMLSESCDAELALNEHHQNNCVDCGEPAKDEKEKGN